MKNKKFILIAILLSGLAAVFLSSCSLMSEYNTNICIYNCEHGKIDVKLISETSGNNSFLLVGYPDSGYRLLAKDIYVYNHNDNMNILVTTLFNQENVFNFTAGLDAKITVSAFFTKIEQE